MNITTHCSSVSTQQQAIISFFPRSWSISGLTVHVQRNQQLCTALVDLEQVGAFLDKKHTPLLDLLSAKEREYFKRFNYPKRRNEWLGGRIAAKTAMTALADYELTPDNLQQITLLPDEFGRPRPDRPTNQGLSISHSSNFAVGLAASGACGIDLQKISSKLPKLSDRFTCAQEISILADRTDCEHTTLLTMIWVAKEAVKKSMLSDQPGIFSGIEILRAAAIADKTFRLLCSVQGGAQQEIIVYDFSPYILALTGADSHA